MRRLLFVAPAVPAPTRGGVRMRGWLFLQGLAREFRITLIAGSPAFPDESPADVAALGTLVDDAVLLRFASRSDPRLALRRLYDAWAPTAADAAMARPTASMARRLARLHATHFDLVHVFRLYMLPIASAALADIEAAPLQIDVDDWESRTRQGLAALAEAHDAKLAARLRAEARHFASLEQQWLPRVAQSFVCAEADAVGLAAQTGAASVSVVENAVAQPVAPPPLSRSEPAEILFVGSLGYLPNDDAVRFLLDAVLPRLRATCTLPFRLVIAGAGARRALRRRLTAAADVSWVEAPADVEPLYRRAQVVAVPVRAGGGTRIKVLEAFAQARPVVATQAAVAGLQVAAGTHYLRAESPEEWARTLAGLLSAPASAEAVVAHAYDWLRSHSLHDAVQRVAALSRRVVG